MNDHRLTREAARMARVYRASIALEALTVVSQLTFCFTGQPWKPAAAAAAAAAIPVSALKAFWWRRRARWYAATDRWWERLEEAPAVTMVFPARVDHWLKREVSVSRFALTILVPVAAVVGAFELVTHL